MTDGLVRIGGASGAWGDSPTAIPQLLTAEVDHLVMDYLAEVTMSLLARARTKDPTRGYPPDFVGDLAANIRQLKERGIRVVTNAGGVNPTACRDALAAAATAEGIVPRIAVVEGDDVMALTDAFRTEKGERFETLPELLTANAYLGALPIRAALDEGADIVVTGRCADSALALGILMHEFGWSADDYDRLAAGSLVGHVLECGPQATGGIHTDWEKVPRWDAIGYPIAACAEDGSFLLTKPPDTGGLITTGVVAEQVLYEVGDPAAYLLPDVCADFSRVTLRQQGDDAVHVSGARGRAPTPTYKVSATWVDGYRAVATFSIVGPDAAAKAERTAETMFARGRTILERNGFAGFRSTHAEALGAEASYPEEKRNRAAREVVLRLVVAHDERRALELFAKEVGSVGISFAPGTTGIMGGRPRPVPLIRLLTSFVAKADVPAPRVSVDAGAPFEVKIPPGSNAPTAAGAAEPQEVEETSPTGHEDVEKVPLRALAYARSGDKGDSSNIAIIARKPEYLAVIRRQVTPERMCAHFGELVTGEVERFDAPGLHAVNFLLQGALGGGGIASPRIDPQGKAFGQMALEMTVEVPRGLIASGHLTR